MRPKRANDDIGEFDLGFDPSISAGKMPTDVTGGMEALSDFMTIPCDKLVPYQSKKDSDFQPLSDEKFQMLLESVKENGVIEPVIVRPLKNDKERFELLAGEHRWKASRAAGFKTIPAHVMRKCDDKTAADIFAITNLVRRENSIRDKINGWWHYTQAIHYKRGGQIQQMLNEGIISPEVHQEAKASMRQVYRYANLHRLIEELLEMVDAKKLSIVSAEQLSYLTEPQQRDLLAYKPYLNSPTKAKALKALSQGEAIAVIDTSGASGAEGDSVEIGPDGEPVENGENDGASGKRNVEVWSIQAVEAILLPKSRPSSTLQSVTHTISEMLRRKLNRSSYSVAPQVLEKALDAFLKEHPEYGR